MTILNDLQNKLNANENNNLPWQELFNNDFMKQYSAFENLSNFIVASGFTIENAKDFQQVPEDQWNEFVKKNTIFDSWEDMLTKASDLWLKRKLGL